MGGVTADEQAVHGKRGMGAYVYGSGRKKLGRGWPWQEVAEIELDKSCKENACK